MASRTQPARRRSIRAMLAPLYVVPLVSLLALWAFAASFTVLNALHEHNFTTENKLYGKAAQSLGLELSLERSQVYVWLTGGRRSSAGSLVTQRRATNAAVTAFEHGIHAQPGMVPASARPAIDALTAALGRLTTIRAEVDSKQLTALQAFQAYNAIVDAQFRAYSELIVVSDTSLYRQASASLLAGRALEMADREVTLVDGALAAGGQMSKGERLLFAQTVASQRLLIGDALKQLDPQLAALYQGVYRTPAHAAFAAIEDRIVASIGSGRRIPVSPAQWSPAKFSFLAAFDKAERQDRGLLAARGTQLGNRLLLEVLLAGGLGLLAVALSAFLMARFGRRITRELTALQKSALDLATERLPRVVEQLGHGNVEVAEPPELAPGRIAEIARVAEAFSSVQHTAVEAAAGQARLRRGVSQVFRNLAWRSQGLLHRQLALLDRMERRSTDPGTLEELFQLDHLTTRMRRHAEGLIILSGEAPGRGWNQPVPVVDVLRAAIAEVEDYTRVSVLTRSADAVAGPAVADVIHLLAELIENATVNSPANTEVTVRAERVANGLVIEVEDRGLGMSDEEMTAANERFASPPEFDLADSDKLGFFVIARLAARHEIRITLRPSPYGGLAAIVLLPHGVTVTGDAADAFDSGQFARPQLTTADWPPASVSPGGPVPSADGPSLAGLSSAGQPPERTAAFGSTPDELGTLAASLQRGWLAGRAEAAGEPDDS